MYDCDRKAVLALRLRRDVRTAPFRRRWSANELSPSRRKFDRIELVVRSDNDKQLKGDGLTSALLKMKTHPSVNSVLLRFVHIFGLHQQEGVIKQEPHEIRYLIPISSSPLQRSLVD